MTETIHTVARDLLVSAYRHVSVAGAAGISAGSWLGRVLTGDRNGYIGNLHRGRLPAVEVFQADNETWTQLSADQGGMGVTRSVWRVRVHVTGADQSAAEATARLILLTGLIQARATDYFKVGNDNISAFQVTALGYMIEVSLMVEIAFGRNDYDIGGAPVAWLPGGIAVATLDFNAASPKLVFAVPAGAVVTGVVLHVITPFDGASPSATVGNDGDPSAYLGAGDSDLTTTDTFWDTAADDAGPQNVQVWLTPGAGATQGQISVQVFIALAT